MQKYLKTFLVVFLVGMIGFLWPVRAEAPEVTLQKEIDELTRLRQMSEQATAPLEAELGGLQNKIKSIRAQLIEADRRVIELEEDIVERSDKLVGSYRVLSVRVRDYYKYSRTSSPLLTLLASSNAPALSRQLSYQSSIAEENRMTIVTMTQELLQLEGDKKQVEERKIALAGLRAQFEEEASFFEGEIAGAKDYQEELTQQISELIAQQNAIIAQKQGSLNLPTSLGGGNLVCEDDRNIDPGFGAGLAFYSYGIPHRVGMNQYGAYGRANAGQSDDEILRAYFNFDDYGNGVSATIRVNDGNGIDQGSVIWTGPLEEYMERLYEVSESWPINTQKAQAIAARSYVMAVTESGNKSICANQYCQVVKVNEPKTGAWKQAVSETSGKVMVQGGQIIKAWYASTAGGYLFNSGDVWSSTTSWTKRMRDTTGDVSSFDDLHAKSYDRESPCFYSAQGWRTEYNKSAWLKPSEVADIVNVQMLAEKDGSTNDYLYQTDKSHPYGGEIWDEERVKQELQNREINPFSSVTSVSVGADFGSGRTTSMTVSGDAGTKSLGVNNFVHYFNLRAPANIQIVGPLFRVETR